MTFGERLRQLRRERQMNQRTLAASVGIDFTYLSKIENGRMDPPSADTIVKLAKALDTDADALLLLAGKVPEDIAMIVTQSPALPAFLRSIRDLREDELRQLRLYAEELREKRGPRKLTRRARRVSDPANDL
jgi:HTH-type transcriptional regulator, competence development regulator